MTSSAVASCTVNHHWGPSGEEPSNEEEDAENDVPDDDNALQRQERRANPVNRHLAHLENVFNLHVNEVIPFYSDNNNDGNKFHDDEFYKIEESSSEEEEEGDEQFSKCECEKDELHDISCSTCHPAVTLQSKFEQVEKVMEIMGKKKGEDDGVEKEEDGGKEEEKNGGKEEEDCKKWKEEAEGGPYHKPDQKILKDPVVGEKFEEVKLSKRTWEDVKITRLKTPPDPCCMGDEVITKFIWKKKPKRRLKVPFQCNSQLVSRLSPKMEEKLSKLVTNSSENVAMLLNIGRQRPLYQEQLDNVRHFENHENINVNWAKFAASAVKPAPNTTKVSRLLIPVICDKLVKLIKYNEELKQYDCRIEYGIGKKEIDEKSKYEKRRYDPVKNVVSKLIDAVVANVENLEKKSGRIIPHNRVARELKRLNASYKDIGDEQVLGANELDKYNLAKVEREYHQTVMKTKDEIIFMNRNLKRNRRRPMKLEDHVLETSDTVERDAESCLKTRSEESFVKSRRTEVNGKFQDEDDSSDPPFLKECSVQLLKSDVTSFSLNEKGKRKTLEETYQEVPSSLPDFKRELLETSSGPRLLKKRPPEDTSSPFIKKRKTEYFGEKNVRPASHSSYKIIESHARKNDESKLKIRLKSTNSKYLNCESNENVNMLGDSSSPFIKKRKIERLGEISDHRYSAVPSARSNTSRTSDKSSKVAVKHSNGFTGIQKRVKTLSPVKRVSESEEISVKIQSVMSLKPDDFSDVTSERRVVFPANDIYKKVVVFPSKVKFLKIEMSKTVPTLAFKGSTPVLISSQKLEFAMSVLKDYPENMMVHIPISRSPNPASLGFGFYFHRETPLTASVGPYQLNEYHNLILNSSTKDESGERQKLLAQWFSNGEFIVAFWKSLNNQFDNYICRDLRNQEVFVFRNKSAASVNKTVRNISDYTENQEVDLDKPAAVAGKTGSCRNQEVGLSMDEPAGMNKSTCNISDENRNQIVVKNKPAAVVNKTFRNLSEEANKLHRENGDNSVSNSIRKFRIMPPDELNSESLELSANNINTRVQSPDLDIVKMEVFSDSEDCDGLVNTTKTEETPTTIIEQLNRIYESDMKFESMNEMKCKSKSPEEIFDMSETIHVSKKTLENKSIETIPERMKSIISSRKKSTKKNLTKVNVDEELTAPLVKQPKDEIIGMKTYDKRSIDKKAHRNETIISSNKAFEDISIEKNNTEVNVEKELETPVVNISTTAMKRYEKKPVEKDFHKNETNIPSKKTFQDKTEKNHAEVNVEKELETSVANITTPTMKTCEKRTIEKNTHSNETIFPSKKTCEDITEKNHAKVKVEKELENPVVSIKTKKLKTYEKRSIENSHKNNTIIPTMKALQDITTEKYVNNYFAKVNVIEPINEKKYPPLVGFKKIAPKITYRDHAASKVYLRIETCKSILIPMSQTSGGSVPPSATITSAKSLLKSSMIEQQTLPQIIPKTVPNPLSNNANVQGNVMKVPVNNPKMSPLHLNAVKMLSSLTKLPSHELAATQVNTVKVLSPSKVSPFVVKKLLTMKNGAPNAVQATPPIVDLTNKDPNAMGKFIRLSMNEQNVLHISSPETEAVVCNQPWTDGVSNLSTIEENAAQISHQVQADPVKDETTTPATANSLENFARDPDALKIVRNWKYNTKYMQSLGLYVDDDE